MMGKDKDKHLSKGSREMGEESSPQKEANDNKVPGKEHQPRGSGKNQTAKNPGKDSHHEKTSSSSRQFIPLVPDFSEQVSSDFIPEINSLTAMSRREVYAMFEWRFLAFKNKIINLKTTSNKQF